MIEVGGSYEMPPGRSRAGQRSRRLQPITLALVDLLLVYLAFVLAYWLRYVVKFGPQIHDQMSFSSYQPVAALLLVSMMLVLLVKGAYRVRLSTEIADEMSTIFSAGTTSIAIVVVVTAMLQRWVYSRGVIVYLWIMMIVLVMGGRASYRWLQGALHRHGRGTLRLAVVGATDVGKMVMQSVMSRPDLGYELVGFVEHRPVPQVRNFGRFRALGTVSDISELIENHVVDEIIVALPASAHEEVWPVLALCERHGVGLKLVPDLFEMSLGRVRLDDIAGIPLLDVRDKNIGRPARLVKRMLDTVIAAAVSVLTLPLVIFLVILIRLDSEGPAILCQSRVGAGGRIFGCYKLRTMHAGAEELQPLLQDRNEAAGPIFKIRDDPRCTRVGRVIRRWSLDELPQMWNVLRGDMSLVGPRPPLPYEVAQYETAHLRRLEVKPGLTGVWQVNGRSHLPFDEMVLMDMYYVDNWSLALDAKILARTVAAVLARRGAY